MVRYLRQDVIEGPITIDHIRPRDLHSAPDGPYPLIDGGQRIVTWVMIDESFGAKRRRKIMCARERRARMQLPIAISIPIYSRNVWILS